MKNEELIAFCQEQHNAGREPKRLEISLDKLTLKSQYSWTEMAVGRVVSDTGVSGPLYPEPSPLSAPLPVQEKPIQVKRQKKKSQ